MGGSQRVSGGDAVSFGFENAAGSYSKEGGRKGCRHWGQCVRRQVTCDL